MNINDVEPWGQNGLCHKIIISKIYKNQNNIKILSLQPYTLFLESLLKIRVALKQFFFFLVEIHTLTLQSLPSFRVLVPGYRKDLDAMGSCR